MTKRIFRSILGVTLVVLAASLVLVTGVLHGYFEDQVGRELAARAAYIARGVEQSGTEYLEDLPGESRITWVDSDGTVLWDNQENPAAMDNHAQRQEIRQALLAGTGTAARYSDTLAQKTLYYALRLSDGSVVRVADTQYTVWAMVLQAAQPVALMMLLAAVLALALASRVSKQLVAPINQMDLDAPETAECYEELSPLLGKIRSQQRQIRRQMEDLRQRQEEFAALTETMSEGFVAVDQETRVLACNPAALRLLGAQAAPEGESVYALNREAPFRRCVEQALAGRRCEVLLESEDSCRQVIASPARREGQTAGAVLMVLDVTEKERRDALRREFTANVSHELKTPLTSILGTAEILKTGMVAPADVEHFAGNIHRQTQRLISLVNDIIRLSRLDEGGDLGPWESVDLHAAARRVLDRLTDAAQCKGVALTLTGGGAVVRSVPRIVEEILYNLCDNAVVYNHPGGSVTVTVENGSDGARVSVTDTGVGIPREAQSRVFERFYRVDKSHSGGGTGLGLSIVKHGAAYLGARVDLESREGRGSTFTVTFPPERDGTCVPDNSVVS